MAGVSDEILQKEFAYARGITYLDHAGATLYSCKQIEDYMKDLTSNLYSNPHSSSPSSMHTTALIDSTRELVLQHFNINSEHYDIIFTSGCTDALRLLSHAFPWQCDPGCSHHAQPSGGGSCVSGGESCVGGGATTLSSLFCYLDDNHTSVVGMREVAHTHGARTICISTSDLARSNLPPADAIPSNQPCLQSHGLNLQHLFAYPAQSNFSGHKYPLSWCADIPSRKLIISNSCGGYGTWNVVLDAASHVSTSPLDISTHQPDFVVISFYKMFGFPTGLGALIVRRESAGILNKNYYGGGTVKATDSWTRFHIAKEKLHDRLEDGTLPFLGILALRHGFDMLTRLGRSMEDIQLHTFQLARLAYSSLAGLRHGNGHKVCVLYSLTEYENPQTQGPIVNFNLLRSDGSHVGYSQVEKLASVCDIHLRTGCFCNTGACMHFLGMNSEQLKYHLKQGHDCGDSLDLIDGRPTGSVRISLGLMSTVQDVNKFLVFIQTNFVEGRSHSSMPEKLPSFSHDCKQGKLKNDCNHPSPGLQYGTVLRCGAPLLPCTQLESGLLSTLTPSPLCTCLPPSPPLTCQPPSSYFSTSAPLTSTPHFTSSFSPYPPYSPPSSSPPSFPHSSPSSSSSSSHSSLRLHSITLYPIKSCAGFKVQQWPVGEKGLLFDREWMIVGVSGYLLSQKQESRLCMVLPSINLQDKILTLRAAEAFGYPDSCSLSFNSAVTLATNSTPHLVTICGDRIQTIDCGDAVAEWLSRVIGRSCRLVRQSPNYKRKVLPGDGIVEEERSLLSLANKGQYLMLSLGSLGELLRNIQEWEGETVKDLAERFRANLVVGVAEGGSGVEPYLEEKWTSVRIGDLSFKVVGACRRCQVVCVEPKTGRRDPEPLKTLLALRGTKASFGIYLSLEGHQQELEQQYSLP